MSQLLAHSETFFIIDDIIADESLDNRRQSLFELAISGRHYGHYLWLLTQSYSTIPKMLRRQAKAIFVWNPKGIGVCIFFTQKKKSGQVIHKQPIKPKRRHIL